MANQLETVSIETLDLHFFCNFHTGCDESIEYHGRFSKKRFYKDNTECNDPVSV